MSDVTVPQQPPAAVPPQISPDGRYWWDGRTWQPTGGSPWPPTARALPENMPIVVIGYITAVFLPIVGLVLGVVAVTRPDPRISRHGAWIIGLSCLVFVAAMLLMLAAAGGAQPVLRGN